MLELRDPDTGQIKSWVWIAGAAVAGIGMLLLTRGGSSGGANYTPGTAEGQSSDITEQLNQLQEAVIGLAGNSNIPQSSATVPSPNPTNPGYLQDIIDQLMAGNKVLEQAQQNLLSLLTKLSSLNTDLSGAYNTRNTLISQREATSRKIADLKLRYADKKISKHTYDTELKKLNATFTQQTNALKSINSTISNLQAAIKDIQTQITALTTSP